METWTKTLDSGESIDTIYLDFVKAFDTVEDGREAEAARGADSSCVLTALTSFSLLLRQDNLVLTGKTITIKVSYKRTQCAMQTTSTY